MRSRAAYRQPGLWVALAAIALLAGIARVMAWKALDDAPGFRVPFLDAAVYDRWARSIAAGNGSGTEVFHLAPLYPILCGLVYRGVPDGRSMIFILQHAAGVLLAIGAGYLAARLTAGREGAPWVVACLIASILVALSSTLIAYEHALLPEVLGAVLLTAGAGCLALGLAGEDREVTPARALVAGILFGLDTLVRPTGLLLVGAAAVFLAVRPPRRQIVAALVLVFGALAAIAPVTIRNRVVAGEWVLVSGSGGFNFYIGNHAGADGGYVQPTGVHFVPGDRGDPTGRALAEEAEGRPLTAREVSRYWLDRGLAFVRVRSRSGGGALRAEGGAHLDGGGDPADPPCRRAPPRPPGIRPAAARRPGGAHAAGPPRTPSHPSARRARARSAASSPCSSSRSPSRPRSSSSPIAIACR